jgi:hypothetical protein
VGAVPLRASERSAASGASPALGRVYPARAHSTRAKRRATIAQPRAEDHGYRLTQPVPVMMTVLVVI